MMPRYREIFEEEGIFEGEALVVTCRCRPKYELVEVSEVLKSDLHMDSTDITLSVDKKVVMFDAKEVPPDRAGNALVDYIESRLPECRCSSKKEIVTEPR